MAFGESNTKTYEQQKNISSLEKRKAAMFSSSMSGANNETAFPESSYYESRDLPLEVIVENPDNKEIFDMKDIEHLAEFTKNEGFYGSVDVFKKQDGTFEIFSGHRRFEAFKYLGKKMIPCRIYEDVNDIKKVELLIGLNIHNRNLSPMEYARAIEYYIEKVLKKRREEKGAFDMIEECSKFFGKSTASIKKYRALLKLNSNLQSLADDPAFPYSAFFKAAQLSEEEQEELYNDIKEFQYKVPDVELSRPVIDNMINIIKKKSLRKEVKQNILINTPPVIYKDNTGTKNTLDTDTSIEEGENITEKYKEIISSKRKEASPKVTVIASEETTQNHNHTGNPELNNDKNNNYHEFGAEDAEFVTYEIDGMVHAIAAQFRALKMQKIEVRSREKVIEELSLIRDEIENIIKTF